jgi:hypothetical protein
MQKQEIFCIEVLIFIDFMTNQEALAIYKEIPDDSSIFPSNLFGENKYDKKVSQFCQFIGFTADIYNKSSRLIKTERFLVIDMIAYKGTSPNEPEEEKQKYYHKGQFSKLIKKITEELNLPICIYDPMERMQEIGEKQGWLAIRSVNSLFVLQKTLKDKVFTAGDKGVKNLLYGEQQSN